MIKLKFILPICFWTGMILAQGPIKDTLYGKVKTVREKLYFLDSLQQNYKLFEDEGEYGHHGFVNRKSDLSRFNTFWYSMPIVHYLNNYREYDSQERISSETWYNKDNSFLMGYEFIYDEKGNLAKETEFDSYGGYTMEQWDYDDNNQKATCLRFYDSPEDYSFNAYQYDNDDNLTEVHTYRKEEKARALRHEYENKRLKRTYLLLPLEVSGKNMHIKFEYGYDERGNKTFEKEYFNEETDTTKNFRLTTYDHDGRNNVINITKHYSNSESSWQFSYNSKNQRVMEQHILNGKVNVKAEIKYKADNVSTLIYNEDGKTSTVNFTYKFDSQNNWTEQTKSVNGKKLYIRKRNIVYH